MDETRDETVASLRAVEALSDQHGRDKARIVALEAALREACDGWTMAVKLIVAEHPDWPGVRVYLEAVARVRAVADEK